MEDKDAILCIRHVRVQPWQDAQLTKTTVAPTGSDDDADNNSQRKRSYQTVLAKCWWTGGEWEYVCELMFRVCVCV